MKKYLGIITVIFLTFLAYGQENPELTKMLKEKYDWVYYNETYKPEFPHYYTVTSKGLKGVCDTIGNLIIPIKYTDISYNDKNRYFTVYNNNKVGLYDVVQNRELIKPIYTYTFIAAYLKNVLFAYTGEEKGHVYSKNGIMIYPKECIHFATSGVNNTDLVIVQDAQTRKYGLYDINGYEILPTVYTYLGSYERGVSFVASKNGYFKDDRFAPHNAKYGIIDIKGVVEYENYR